MGKKTINTFSKAGIQFMDFAFVVELFPSPIPHEICDIAIDTNMDLVLMSAHFEFNELYLPSGQFVHGTSKGQDLKFTCLDFVKWQLSTFNPQTLYFLANKTSTNIADMLDGDEECANDINFDPEAWLHPYGISDEDFQKGLAYIERLKNEYPEQLYERIANGVLDKDTGVLCYLETEVFDEVDVIRELYQDWPVPLMVVSEGDFSAYIDPKSSYTLMRSGYRLSEMHVRNYDEGEIN